MLVAARQTCPDCGGHMRLRYENRRTLVTLSGAVRLRLRIRRCEAPGCARFHVPYRPEAEGALALPQHEFGLDVIALVGVLRHRDHRSVPEIHAALRGRGVEIAERSVTNLLDRYDELLATDLTGARRLRRRLNGERCETISGYRSCTIGRFVVGRIVTDFRIRNRHVVSVVVGRVVD